MAKTHKGIYQYTGDEGTNISLGQTGFKVVTTSNDNTAIAASDASNGSEWFVALKAIGDGVSVSADSLQGDNFTDDGAAAGSGNRIALAEGEIIWGVFSSINPLCAASDDMLIAYYG